jgi:hypothetical protein
MSPDLILGVTLGLLVVLLVIAVIGRKVLLWMDERGWIHLPDPPSDPGPAALLELHAMLQPQVRHFREARRQQEAKVEQDDAGGPDDPAHRPRRRRARSRIGSRRRSKL